MCAIETETDVAEPNSSYLLTCEKVMHAVNEVPEDAVGYMTHIIVDDYGRGVPPFH